MKPAGKGEKGKRNRAKRESNLLYGVGEVIREYYEGVEVRVNGKRYLLGRGAYLIWRSLDGVEMEELIAQAVALTGLRREEVENNIRGIIDKMLKLGLAVEIPDTSRGLQVQGPLK